MILSLGKGIRNYIETSFTTYIQVVLSYIFVLLFGSMKSNYVFESILDCVRCGVYSPLLLLRETTNKLGGTVSVDRPTWCLGIGVVPKLTTTTTADVIIPMTAAKCK